MDEQSRPQLVELVHPPCERSKDHFALVHDERADQLDLCRGQGVMAIPGGKAGILFGRTNLRDFKRDRLNVAVLGRNQPSSQKIYDRVAWK